MSNRRRGPVLVIILLWVLVLSLVIGLLFINGMQSASTLAGLLGALTGFVAFVLPVAERTVTRIRDRLVHVHQLRVSTADLLLILQRLSEALKDQWREEARTRRLQDPAPLPVTWELGDPELADVGHPRSRGNGAAGAAVLSGGVADLVELFRRLEHKRLVILGEPGAGKTVYCILFTLGLLNSRGPEDPVPVMVPIASWNPIRSSFRQWLTEHLSENYFLTGPRGEKGEAVVQTLLAGAYLIPILDGLDEMPEELQAYCVTRLNRELDEGQAVVLTCRTADYRRLAHNADVVTLSTAVQLRPLAIPQVTTYLADTTPPGRRGRWDDVFVKLTAQPDSVLSDVLRTPLMVSLARSIYSDSPRDPRALLDAQMQNREGLEDHLLDEIVPAAYSTGLNIDRVFGERWAPRQVRAWLEYLAQQMNLTGRTGLNWWQLEGSLPWFVPHIIGDLCAVLVAVIAFPAPAAALAACVVLAARLLSRDRSVTLESLIGKALDRRLQRMASGSLVARLVGLTEGVPLARRSAVFLTRLASILLGFYAGLSSYTGRSSSAGDIYRASAIGVSAALGTGIVLGTLTLSSRTTPREVNPPGWRGGAVFMRHLAVGLVIGVLTGLLAQWALRSSFGLMVGIALGVVTGAVDGLNVWLDVNADTARALSPESTLRADRAAAFARALAVLVLVGVAVFVVQILAFGWISGLVNCLAFGVAYALGDRYSGLAETAWGRYVVSTLWLGLAGHLPWHLTAFLEDARSRGLLRTAGVTYEFRHSRLQERLVDVSGRPGV